MSSANNVYKPNLDILNNDSESDSEWVTVSSTKKSNVSKNRDNTRDSSRNSKTREMKNNERKKRNLEYRLSKSVNNYIDNEFKNEALFITKLLEDNIQISSEELKDKVNSYLDQIEKNLENVKKSRSFSFLNSIKQKNSEIVSKVNSLVNENNLYILAGKGMLLNSDNTSLFENEKYSHLKDKYETYLTKVENAKKVLAPKKSFDPVKSKVKEGVSFASLFKN